VGPEALVTISANWPKSVINLSTYEETRLSLLDLEILPWLSIGVIVLLLNLLVLWRLRLVQNRSEEAVARVSPQQPSRLSPLLVGVLVEKKIYPRELVALLVDFCQRGYIVILKKGGSYYLSQRKALDVGLEPWERELIEEVFTLTNRRVSPEQIEEISKRTLFSPKIKAAFSQIYQVVTDKQFFAENPHITRVRYKLIALGFYFVSILGAIWVAVSGISPYLILPFASTMLVTYFIIKLTPRLVSYTKLGLQEREDWLAFANFLKEPKPLPLEAARTKVFETYLAYAIALNQTEAWAKRFDLSSTLIIKPDWLITYDEGSTGQFVEEIVNFTEAISRLISEMRGPLVS
jgi:hypothetical protein